MPFADANMVGVRFLLSLLCGSVFPVKTGDLAFQASELWQVASLAQSVAARSMT